MCNQFPDCSLTGIENILPKNRDLIIRGTKSKYKYFTTMEENKLAKMYNLNFIELYKF